MKDEARSDAMKPFLARIKALRPEALRVLREATSVTQGRALSAALDASPAFVAYREAVEAAEAQWKALT